MSSESIRVALIRLCECEGNKLGKIATHGSLTKLGREQALAVRKRLVQLGFRACACPDNSACRETSAIIAAGASVIGANVFCEPPYPRWAGREYESVKFAFPDEWFMYWHPQPGDSRRVIVPDGETWQTTFDRARNGFQRLHREHPGPGLVAIVTHGAVVHLLTMGLLDAPLEHLWQLGGRNGGITIFDFDGALAKFECINETAHLDAVPADVGHGAPGTQ